jgi:hypothetical protein
MARTFLRHIRVGSIDELKARILKGIDEINASPVVFRWNKFDLGVALCVTVLLERTTSSQST